MDNIKLYNFHEVYDAEKQILKNPENVCKFSSECEDPVECELCKEITESIHTKLKSDTTSKSKVDLEFLRVRRQNQKNMKDLETIYEENKKKTTELKENDEIIRNQIEKLKFKNELLDKLKGKLQEGQTILESSNAQKEIGQHDRTAIYFFNYYLFSIPTSWAIIILFVIFICLCGANLYFLRNIIQKMFA